LAARGERFVALEYPKGDVGVVEGLGEEEGGEAGTGDEDGLLRLGHRYCGVVERSAKMWRNRVCGGDDWGGLSEERGWSCKRARHD